MGTETRIRLAKLYESDNKKYANYKFRYDECKSRGELEEKKEEQPKSKKEK